MPKDFMRYDLLAQDALRGVVKLALERVHSQGGLPGGHHFYITFITGFPGVEISDALQARYPVDMTIVLQHQYWDLEVNEDHFAISLSFNKVPERIVIPYKAIRGFIDPEVQFGLEFQVEGFTDTAPSTDSGTGTTSAEITTLERATAERGGEDALRRLLGDSEGKGGASIAELAARSIEDLAASRASRDGEDDGDDDTPGAPEKSGEVVQLDAFRKK